MKTDKFATFVIGYFVALPFVIGMAYVVEHFDPQWHPQWQSTPDVVQESPENPGTPEKSGGVQDSAIEDQDSPTADEQEERGKDGGLLDRLRRLLRGGKDDQAEESQSQDDSR